MVSKKKKNPTVRTMYRESVDDHGLIWNWNLKEDEGTEWTREEVTNRRAKGGFARIETLFFATRKGKRRRK